jgi:uncharacterized Rmd1/YagE family protein
MSGKYGERHQLLEHRHELQSEGGGDLGGRLYPSPSSQYSQQGLGFGRNERQYSDADDDYDATLPRASKTAKTAKTGRQRRKQVARGGGKVLPSIRKRRVSVSRLPFEIKTDELFDNIESAQYRDWRRCLYNGEVIRLFKEGADAPISEGNAASSSSSRQGRGRSHTQTDDDEADEMVRFDDEDDDGLDDGIFAPGAKEVFIFDFGVAVFWGFPIGGSEEQSLLATIRKYRVAKSSSWNDDSVTTPKDKRAPNEGLGVGNWQSMESVHSSASLRGYADLNSTTVDDADDDMAFLLDRSRNRTILRNDVIILNKDSAKERLALSYGIAQSAVLAVFESRVDDTQESTKWIPESLARTGKCDIDSVQLGKMIGSVFVIRHEVNLYHDILDIPDFFWNEERYEPEYKLMTSYLEIDHRVTVLNTRVDMLRELLEVLQGQLDNAHGSNLEWIVIWLIVVEVVLQVVGMIPWDDILL